MKQQLTVEKEISWLAFNERVLQEAMDKRVPLVERIRFLGIFSNNLDEFFRVRVADVKRRILIAQENPGADLRLKQEQKLLKEIQAKVQQLQTEFDETYRQILSELEKRNVQLLDETQLTADQGEWVRGYFYEEVLPILSTWLVSSDQELPPLRERSIYLAVQLKLKSESDQYSLIEIPSDRLDRFVPIPRRYSKGSKAFILLDNIIRYCLFEGYQEVIKISDARAFMIKVTRDAELQKGEGIAQSLLDQISWSLKKRLDAAPVRFVYDGEMPDEMVQFFVDKLGLSAYESLMPGGRYHNFRDFMSFPAVGRGHMLYQPMKPLRSKYFDENRNAFKAIRQQDILLYYPYHTFRHFNDLLRQASLDPKVTSISISLYRVAKDSRVINSLICAARNDKYVKVSVELQARFDEEANIEWSKVLTDAGVEVEFGIPNLKVHTKICLIKRMEQGTEVRYAHIGTGNFNESTARIYTDFSLFTCHPEITDEVEKVFDFISYGYRRFEFNHLWVSPLNARDNFRRLINNEIRAAKKGKEARIILKANNLVDAETINLLCEASQAGVKIQLIIRGMCCVVPGVKGVSDNITAISIVDRFLEHPRVSVFHNEGDQLVFISSADLMQRNLDYRVEVGCPVLDSKLKQKIIDILEIQLADRAKARVIDAELTNRYVPRGNRKKIRSQMEIYQYLSDND